MPANTSPDNIQFPVAGDQVAPLNTVFQNVAQTTQNAFSLRANFSYRWANAAARTAQTGMRNGDQGYQVDTGVWYDRTGSVWVAQREALATALTASAGFTITSQILRRTGNVIYVVVQVTKSTTFGGNDVIATLNVPSLRPAPASVHGSGLDSNTGAFRYAFMVPNGQITLFGASGVAGSNPQEVNFSYIIA